MYLTSLNVAFPICKVGTAVLLVWLGIVNIKWAEWKVLSSVPGTCGHSWQAAILSLPLGLSDLTAPAEFTPLHSRSPPNLLPRHSLSTLFYLCFFHSDLSQIVKCKLLSVPLEQHQALSRCSRNTCLMMKKWIGWCEADNGAQILPSLEGGKIP